MTRTIHASICALLLVAPACGSDDRQLVTPGVDCTAANAYELLNIFDFEGSDSGWYLFTDHTPGGVPDPTITSNVAVAVLDPPRCDSHQALEFLAYGNNYWGAGFGDWAHNSAPADGTGYEGISFWARSPGNTDKTFLLPSAMTGIRRLAQLYDQHLAKTVLVSGHTDRAGDTVHNLALSVERAQAVAAFLQDEVDDWLPRYKAG